MSHVQVGSLTILVGTDLYDLHQGPPSHCLTHKVQDVALEQAVQWALGVSAEAARKGDSDVAYMQYLSNVTIIMAASIPLI
jgi:hypothetical protein